ncbi:MAG: thiol:disulfide interchange protein DsbA/DsbL [Proteobacteria bacterium]|nr:thiol:disulfide interchange protein DsbA/DsbL [Pseudomonadota bacterium]
MSNVRPFFSRSSWLMAVFAWAALSLPLLSPNALAAVTEGKEFKQISPQTTEVPEGKIEVIEFFSYLCSHCAHFNPLVETWKKKLPDDVVFYKIPVGWGKDQWKAMARAYYALTMMGEEERLSNEVFDALHKERINLTDKKTFLDWAEKKGVNRQKLIDVYDSFAVDSKVMQSDKKVETYKVSSVPHFFVNGRYEINLEAAGSPSQVFDVLDEVIALARKEAKKK